MEKQYEEERIPSTFLQNNRNFLSNFNFKFEGLNSDEEKDFINCVEELGATVCQNKQYILCDEDYFAKPDNKSRTDLYSIDFLTHAIENEEIPEIEMYRFINKSTSNKENHISNGVTNENTCIKEDKEEVGHDSKQDSKTLDAKVPKSIVRNENHLKPSRCSERESKNSYNNTSKIPLKRERSFSSEDKVIKKSNADDRGNVIYLSSDEEDSNDTKKFIKKVKNRNDAVVLTSSPESDNWVDSNKNRSDKKIIKANTNKKSGVTDVPASVKSSVEIIELRDEKTSTSSIKKEKSSTSIKREKSSPSLSREKRSTSIKREKPSTSSSKEKQSTPKKESSSSFKRIKVLSSSSEDETNDDENKETIGGKKMKSSYMRTKYCKTGISKNSEIVSTPWITVKNTPNNAVETDVKSEQSSPVMFSDIDEDNNFKEEWWIDHPVPADEACTYQDCTYEPGVHKRHPRPSKHLSIEEKQILLKYLIKREAIQLAKGISVYSKMHNEGYLVHRSIETLRNCFRRSILRNVSFFRLPQDISDELLEMDQSFPKGKGRMGQNPI